jgi:hypothetical protein
MKLLITYLLCGEAPAQRGTVLTHLRESNLTKIEGCYQVFIAAGSFATYFLVLLSVRETVRETERARTERNLRSLRTTWLQDKVRVQFPIPEWFYLLTPSLFVCVCVCAPAFHRPPHHSFQTTQRFTKYIDFHIAWVLPWLTGTVSFVLVITVLCLVYTLHWILHCI